MAVLEHMKSLRWRIGVASAWMAFSGCAADPDDVGEHQLASHACTGGVLDECDDGVPCTIDVCDLLEATCIHTSIAGCCSADAECNDETLCTIDTCDLTDYVCVHWPPADCCETATDCDDSNPCTTDSCDLVNRCGHAPVPDCSVPDAGGDVGGGDVVPEPVVDGSTTSGGELHYEVTGGACSAPGSVRPEHRTWFIIFLGCLLASRRWKRGEHVAR